MSLELQKIGKEALDALSIAAKERHPIACLEQLGVNQRLINLLCINGINDINDLLHKSKDELLKLNNFGSRQLQILFEAMSKYHLIED